MVKTSIFDFEHALSKAEKERVIEFLYDNLDEYGDPKPDIEAAINYALKETDSFGGFVLVSHYEGGISGVVVVNRTGMKGYIPENILVYIATHQSHRGRGIGKQLMEKAMEYAKGSMALHVEPENPARFLYAKLGFTNKYLEMRYKKED